MNIKAHEQAERGSAQKERVSVTNSIEWLLTRLDVPPDVRVARNPHGTWDVLLRIDGGYANPGDALRMVEVHRAEVAGLVVGLRGEPDAAA